MAKVKRRTWINKDGTKCQAWAIDYTDSFGKRIRTSGFKTKADAESALAKAVTEVDEGTSLRQDKTITFAMASKKFLDLHASIHCKKSTYIFYTQALNNHLLPFFGKDKIIDITPNRINLFMKHKLNEGLSPKSVNHFLTLMGSVFQRLVDNGVLINNPVRKVRRLRLPHKEMKFLTPEEIKVVLDIAYNYYPEFYPLLLMAILTGMRRGELLALTWQDINWQKRTIYVNKSYYLKEVTTPKTPQSIRRIDMATELVKELRSWKLRCPHNKLDLVFPSQNGKHLDPDNLVKRKFAAVFRKAQLELIRFHDLRHTYAALLIAQNVPIKYIQSQMGHSSIQVTLDNYGHLMPEVNQKGIDALDSLFGRQGDGEFSNKKCKAK